MTSRRTITRRKAMATAAGGLAAISAIPVPAFARLEGPTLDEEIEAFAKGATPRSAGLSLGIEDVVEDGYNVPVTIDLDHSPLGGVRLEEFVLLAPENPRIQVALCGFSRLSGSPRVETRVRLAKSQTVTALARLSDGTVLRADRAVTVIVGGCDIP
ncbi:sulfur oxidation protein SoxY [Hartmannibacter diazotrophicus]|uniref:Sulfur oxidation protein SoxY n=1 Tax=Hartmannibacter diazotrophicus TaxID=1482074 RepID=A0A2C9D669_9HYPH|nr:thiosulfate oxidation carrier protein SoxY [Hartmannibacter diazotrophicus]SON55015.1 sulfur oxidation protein SoxY [Hartmannibacter diazotrophicus]